MYQPLRPCPACARHVRAVESACPFCAAALVPEGPTAPRPEGPRLSRSAMLLLGSAALAEACQRSAPVANVYGAPPPPTPVADAGPAAAPRSPPDDPGSSAEVYGAPPPRPLPQATADAGAARKR
jgi:hypothetical protein